MNIRPFFLVLIILFLASGTTRAEQVLHLRAPSLTEGSHAYYHELMVKAFAVEGIELRIDPVQNPPKARLAMMLTKGELAITWMVQSAERDKSFVPVMPPLTNGMVGQRVLMIRPQDQALFDKVRTLDDLRRLGLRAGMGRDWAEQDIWQRNGLPFTNPSGDWRRLFDMLAVGGRDVDYIPRALSEILIEAPAHPDLGVEKNLLLVYDRDVRFYLSPLAAHLAPVLERGLRKLREDGAQERLLEKHFGRARSIMEVDKRTILHLADGEETVN
ncbi:hypothetical protein [Niveispirillum sp. KHB5.9]|uniref:hypothetical protein n=1 Tax=Niveispirillum sp. KHB5.9 TaxID=3400269 RepID=UPI003A83648D